MKIKKGLPPGYIPVREDIRPLVEKMHEIDPADLKELDAFMDYLQKGPEEFQETEPEEGKSSRKMRPPAAIRRKLKQTRDNRSFQSPARAPYLCRVKRHFLFTASFIKTA